MYATGHDVPTPFTDQSITCDKGRLPDGSYTFSAYRDLAIPSDSLKIDVALETQFEMIWAESTRTPDYTVEHNYYGNFFVTLFANGTSVIYQEQGKFKLSDTG